MFRAAAKAATRHEPDEAPQPRKRSSGETGKAFGMAARQIIRRAIMPTIKVPRVTGKRFVKAARKVSRRVIALPAAAHYGHLFDTFAWLNTWQNDDWNYNDADHSAGNDANQLSHNL